MLAIVLALTIFSSLVWCGWATHFVIEALHGISLVDAGLLNAILYILFVCLPLLLIWLIFGFITQTFYNMRSIKNSQRLFAQMKKNQEYSDLLARIMLTSEQDNKCSFEMGRFDLLLSDINELLSEFIVRQRLADEEQIEYLWKKVQNGGKWSFGKVIIENFNRQPNFKQKIMVNAASDNMLSGTILEFCARYRTIIELLEKYDHEKIFLDLLETGVLGKVYALLLPIGNELKRLRESSAMTSYTKDEPKASAPSFAPAPAAPLTAEQNKDEFSLALERSFGRNEAPMPQRLAPVFDNHSILHSNEPVLSAPEEMTETQKTLASLKKEWADSNSAMETKGSVDDLTYPFGGWSDEQNYKK